MLVVSFTSASGSARRFAPVDRVCLAGNAVQLGSLAHSIASYAAGLWFFGGGEETYERLTIENRMQIHFEDPAASRSECGELADRAEVAGAEIRLNSRDRVAHLDASLQNWYRIGSTHAWPVVIFQSH